jgi:hypothetical protein
VMNDSDQATAAGRDRDALPARRRWWPVVTPVFALAIAVSLVFPAGRHQWALSIFRQPTRYTALSFKYAWLLPSTATVGSPIPVFFTVSNDEGRPLTYRYVLRQVDPLGTTRTLSTAARNIASGRTWTVATSVRPTCSLSPCRIDVLLPGHPETVDFLVVLKAAPRQHKKDKRNSRSHSGRSHRAGAST